jgi:hypothetical protein
MAILIITVLELVHALAPVILILPDINGLVRPERFPDLFLAGNIPPFAGHFHHPVVQIESLGTNLGDAGYRSETVNYFLGGEFVVRRLFHPPGKINGLTDKREVQNRKIQAVLN